MKILHLESSFLREMFVETFVDKTCEYYVNRIQDRHVFSDGLHYTGYYWDCMINREMVSQNYIIDSLQKKEKEIFILWDDHSRDLILIDNYWIYPKDSVLSISPCELIEVLPSLPDDCYFFDDTLSWAAALTHEEVNNGRRLCFYVEQKDRGRFA